MPPIVVDRVSHESELVIEETFGPVIPIIRVPNDDEATMEDLEQHGFRLVIRRLQPIASIV